MNELIRFRKAAMLVGVMALVISAIGAVFQPNEFFRSYLIAFLFWLAVALGCLPLLMLHHLAGGGWGFALRRILEAATRTLPLSAIFFVPVVFGIHSLYEWSQPDVLESDAILSQKTPYLNVPFFLTRALIYFAAWMLIAHFLNKWSNEQDETGDLALIGRFQRLGGAGIFVYGVTITFASIDWAMSLEPHWFSTIYGALFMVGQVLTALAFTIPIAALLSDTPPASQYLGPDVFQDLGNLMLTFIMLWAYMSFSQYLIIWSGNLPEEIPWYLRRSARGWQWLAAFLALLHFAVPFLVLLARGNKRKRGIIAIIAVAILIMRWFDLYWLVAPAFYDSLTIHWLAPLITLGLGGIWFTAFVSQLQKKALLPLRDPYFAAEEAA
jgi:hypothetical protein